MRDINEIDIRLVDTTILMVFLSAMRYRKATAVAKEMGLTQPAVSHALNRLRVIFGDRLFLRRAHGLEPTALAHELEPKVRKIVSLISETLKGFEEFDPNTIATDLRIGAFDYELAGIVPQLITKLQNMGPNINVHAFPLQNEQALEAMAQGQIDVSIGYFDFSPQASKSFIAETLYKEDYVLAGRRGHPVFSKPLTLKSISAENHLLISPYGPIRNLVDHALLLKGMKRNIQTVVPSLFSALAILETSDLVATIPARVARANGPKFKITHRPLPIQGGTFQIHAVRHIRDLANPLHLWLMERLRELVIE